MPADRTRHRRALAWDCIRTNEFVPELEAQSEQSPRITVCKIANTIAHAHQSVWLLRAALLLGRLRQSADLIAINASFDLVGNLFQFVAGDFYDLAAEPEETPNLHLY